MTTAALQDIDCRQMILAIETAVSLVGMNDTNHGKRVGFIASQLGKQLGLDDADLQFLFELGLLHDCGVSTEQMHDNLVNNFEWADAHIHCEIGQRLLQDFAPLAHFATPILYHHTSWPELQSCGLNERDAMFANLVFLADRIDILAAAHYETDILLARKEIVRTISEEHHALFNPAFIDAFMAVEQSEAFWIALEDRHITRYTWDMGLIESNQSLTLSQIKQLSLILSYIVDQKSPFTAQHSVRVADLAKYLAEQYGLTEEQCDKIEIAGLLHDLGKLHTPDRILEKKGPLDDIERSIMDQHSYETYEILRHVKGLGEVALWSAYHHEGLNGVGYPFHPNQRELNTEARVIAVADVFQALVQDRPYRSGMALNQILTLINGMVESGKLDASIVDIVNRNADTCFRIGKGTDPHYNQPYVNLFPERKQAAG